MGEKSNNSGDRGEAFVQMLCDASFIRDFVFRAPHYNKGKLSRELTDVLVLFDDVAIVIEVKAAEDEAHSAYSLADEAAWAQKRYQSAANQAEGAFKTLRKGLIKSVSNKWQGQATVDPSSIKKHFAIVAIEHPPVDKLLHPPVFHYQDISCPCVAASFDELQEMFRELSTIRDFVEYLEHRTALLLESHTGISSELDVVAFWKTRNPTFRQAVGSKTVVHFEAGIWEEFASAPERAVRDTNDAKSYIIDNIITDLYRSKGWEQEARKLWQAAGAQFSPKGTYVDLACALARLSRTERRQAGDRLFEKSALHIKTGLPRHFAFVPEPESTRDCFVFVVSDGKREERIQTLFSVAASLSYRYPTRRVIGVAISSSKEKNASTDACVIDIDSLTPWDNLPPSHQTTFSKLLGPDKHVVSDEFVSPPAPVTKPSAHKASRQRFKKRKPNR